MKAAQPISEKDRTFRRKRLVARGMEWWRRLTAAQRRRLGAFLGFVVILTLAFLKPLGSLMVYASRTELHSHIVIVPLVSLYLLCINKRKLPVEFTTSPGWGAVLGVAGMAFLGCAWSLMHATPPLSTNDRHVLPALSFVSLLAAGGFFFLGRMWMTAAAFPVAFLLFMVPLPDAVVHLLETASQQASAEATSWYFTITGVPFLRDVEDGTVFYLPAIGAVKVAQECSGIRSSWVLFITSLIAGHMFLTSPWRRVIFVSLVIPLGILRNGMRILVISWLALELGPHMFHHWIHHNGGPLFFLLSLIPLFLILWWLRRGERRAARRVAQKDVEIGNGIEQETAETQDV